MANCRFVSFYKSNYFIFWILSIFTIRLLGSEAHAEPTSQSYTLGILGDSRTEAIFADIPIGQVQSANSKAQTALLEFFFRNVLFVSLPKPSSDELTLSRAHMKRVQVLFSRRTLSGIAGNRNYSLPVRLEKKWKKPVVLENFSEPGMSYLVASQAVVFEMMQTIQRKKVTAQGLAIELGAVDFLINQSEQDFEQAVSLTLNRLRAFLPSTFFYISSLPPIVDLFLTADYPATYDEQGNILTTCQDIYDKTGYGRKLLLRPDAAPDIVEKQRKRFEAFNEILVSQVNKLNELSNTLGYNGKAEIVTQQTPENLHSYLAFDCLHPNPAGQAKTADEFFQRISLQSLDD